MSRSQSQVLDPKTRENRGVISKETAYTDKENREAVKTRWIFFCRYDKSVFKMELNHCSWPVGYSLFDKINLTKRTVVDMKTTEGNYLCQFIERCHHKEADQRVNRYWAIINRSKENNESLAELSMALELVIFSNP